MFKSGRSKKAAIVRVLSWCVIIAAISLSSCGGGGGSTTATCTCPTGTPFWAANLTTNSLYCVCADEYAVGTHSRIFVEHGLIVPDALSGLQTEFDSNIYPTDIANFGSEPNPGIDGDPLITILLLNIKDGFNGTTVKSYAAGYFDPSNEYPLSAYRYSNQREMFFMNINPTLNIHDPATFYRTLTHEFQHMIHWEQKNHLKNLDDETWLNEAMSEIAPTFLYGPSLSRVYTYEQDPSNSLTTWNGDIFDYGIAYMWSQYYKDQFGGSIFRSMMTTTSIGITSVDEVLAAAFPGMNKTFDSTFNDLSIAIYSGSTPTWLDHPEWSYTAINTAPSTSGGITLPGLLVTGNHNPTTLPALGPWSIGFSWYEPLSQPTPTGGTVTWTASVPEATFIDYGGGTITTNITSGASYTYTTKGILIVTNPSSGSASSGGNVVRTAPLAMGPSIYHSPKQMLAAANVLSQAEGKPVEVCVHSAFLEREKELRRKGFKPGF
jgi:hypothetical protein